MCVPSGDRGTDYPDKYIYGRVGHHRTIVLRGGVPMGEHTGDEYDTDNLCTPFTGYALSL